MSKKKPARKTPSAHGNSRRPPLKNQTTRTADNKKQWIALAILAVITYIVFYPSPKTEFTNWDDGTYVSENPMIWQFDAQHIKNIFINPPEKRNESFFSWFTPVSLNYHPLTMVSLAMNYKFSKLNAVPYVLTNNIIHILNVLLVFVFMRMLMEGYNRRAVSEGFTPDPFVTALATAAFWAIHPMRVESVTWIAERKDVLYMFFFLASLITYLKWLDDKKTKWIIACFLLFICSCLSKGMAVVLPVVLVLIDWFYGDARTSKQIGKSILRKWYFFAAALFFGVVAFKIQSMGAIAAMETFTLFQRLTFGCYGFIMYIWKMILPIHLSAFYPYPFTDAQGNIPAIYYASPFIVLLLACAVLFLAWKKPVIGRPLVFGFAFYFITVALVLQFISVGSVIMADRYAYASYTGLFFMTGYFFDFARKRMPASLSYLLSGALVCTAGWFSYLTFERTKIWTNAETLWTDAMNQFPFIEIAYENRGIYYKDHNQLDKMLKDYEFVTQKLNSKNEKIWSNLGNLYGLMKEFDKSLAAYSKAIEYNPANASTYLNRAITYSMMGKYAESLPDFDKSLELGPDVALTYKNRAYTLLQLGQYDKSISDYDKAISLYAYDTLSYLNRGISKFNAKKFPEALEDFKTYISKAPNNAQAYFNASISAKSMNNFEEAMDYAKKAQQLGHPVSPEYLKEIEANLGKE